jgi:hypothetical protein
MVFRRKKRITFIHEDEYCQQQLLPYDDLEYCVNVFKIINQEYDAHIFQNEAVGKFPLRKTGLIEFKIPYSKIKDVVEEHFQPFDVLETGSYNDRIKSANTEAFGSEAGTKILIELNKTKEIVENIWFDFYGNDKGECCKLESIFQVIAGTYDLIYLDLRCCRLFKLKDRIAINEYIHCLQKRK